MSRPMPRHAAEDFMQASEALADGGSVQGELIEVALRVAAAVAHEWRQVEEEISPGFKGIVDYSPYYSLIGATFDKEVVDRAALKDIEASLARIQNALEAAAHDHG